MAVGISFCFFILAVFVRSLTECSYYTMSTKLVEDLAKWPGMTRTKLVRDLAKCSYYTTKSAVLFVLSYFLRNY